jgi:hypothetical protein
MFSKFEPKHESDESDECQKKFMMFEKLFLLDLYQQVGCVRHIFGCVSVVLLRALRTPRVPSIRGDTHVNCGV